MKNELAKLNKAQTAIYVVVMLGWGASIALAVVTAITYLQGR
jgi:hypothetical protein